MFSTAQDNWREIAEEASALDRNSVVDVSYAKSRIEAATMVLNSGKIQWAKGWDGYGEWLAWGVMLDSYFLGGLPKTQEYLSTIPGLNFAAFLVLKGGAVLKNHAHPENAGILTYHLGLDVPEECYLNTDGEFVRDENGKGYIFDGTKPHYAFNASGKDRLILHCEYAA